MKYSNSKVKDSSGSEKFAHKKHKHKKKHKNSEKTELLKEAAKNADAVHTSFGEREKKPKKWKQVHSDEKSSKKRKHRHFDDAEEDKHAGDFDKHNKKLKKSKHLKDQKNDKVSSKKKHRYFDGFKEESSAEVGAANSSQNKENNDQRSGKKKRKGHSTEETSGGMLVSPGISWYDQMAEDTGKKDERLPSHSDVSSYQALASKLLKEDCQKFNEWQRITKKGTDYEWTQTVLGSGTLSDKVAVYTLLIQESPAHNLTYIDELLKMVRGKGSKEITMAIETLKDLFLFNLLVPSRKMEWMKDRPLLNLPNMMSGNKREQNKLLLLWYVEDQLKSRYANFVSALTGLSHNSVEQSKEKVITAIHLLLAGHIEQRQALLMCLINKIGDPARKIASHTSYRLCLLLDEHPNMKMTVVKEVEKLLFRDNLSPRAQYYGICFLTQILFDPEDSDLAAKMINIYLGFFKAAIKKGEVESRMMSGLLTGVQRALPYASASTNQVLEHIDTMYKLQHLSTFNLGIQVLSLLQRLSFMSAQLTDRYYCSLYRKLFDHQLFLGSSRHLPNFLNLIYFSLKKDSSEVRVLAMIRRLLQGCKYEPPQLICGILILISELLKIRSSLRDLFMSAGSTNQISVDFDSDDEERYCDIDEKGDEVAVDAEHPASQSSWIHKQNLNKEKEVKKKGYDPLHRNPQFAGADCCASWELEQLSQHYHPTVQLFSQSLLRGDPIQYTGDPLQDFSLNRFLDRFVFRNPKKTTVGQADSRKILGKRDFYEPLGARSLRVDSEKYLQLSESEIPPEELFLYNYLKKKEAERPAKEEDDEDESDVESVASDEFMDYLEKSGPQDVIPRDIDDDFDFAEDFQKKKSDKAKKSKKGDEEEDSDEGSFDLGGEDMESESEKDSDEDNQKGEGDDDDDDDEGDFSDDDLGSDDEAELESAFPGVREALERDMEDDDGDEELFKSMKKRSSKGSKSKENKEKVKDMFAPAEQFAEMLEDNTGVDMSGSAAVEGADKTAPNQLKWEQRDRKNDWRRHKNIKRKFHGTKKGKFKDHKQKNPKRKKK